MIIVVQIYVYLPAMRMAGYIGKRTFDQQHNRDEAP